MMEGKPCADVYFTDFRTTLSESLPQKLGRLIREAGIGRIDFKGKYAAIKIHFGEPGNLAFLRPQYARAVADEVRALGGKPFLTDANTLYAGKRQNALDHLDSACRNGFTPCVTGCQILIADGLKGRDETRVPVPDGKYVKEAKIARAVMEADVVISLTHFKGHEQTGIGGALKNLGMGCGSRAGKMEMHSSGKPRVDARRCVGCRVCAGACAHGAILFPVKKARIDRARCVGCGACIGACPRGAVELEDDEAPDALQAKIAEYAAAVLRGRPAFHVSLVCDVSPCCDCHSENDAPVVPDIGMLAGFDPVALDQACCDLCLRAVRLPGSALDGAPDTGDVFTDIHPGTCWRRAIEEAERMKLGTRFYTLHRI